MVAVVVDQNSSSSLSVLGRLRVGLRWGRGYGFQRGWQLGDQVGVGDGYLRE
jgi:hypothetical protein